MRYKRISEITAHNTGLDEVIEFAVLEGGNGFTRIKIEDLALKYIEANKDNEAFVEKVLSILNIDVNIKKDFISGEQSIGTPYDQSKLDLNR